MSKDGVPPTRLKRKGRSRNKHRLLEKWNRALETADAPGDAVLVGGYRPSGLCAPVDVPEIAGLIVWDADRRAHHFRLYRDGTVAFIESPENPDAPVMIDPMVAPAGDSTIYLTAGPPPAVTTRIEALDVTPRWADVCTDGAHDFEIVNDGGRDCYQFVQCEKCETTRSTLSWLGHAVPRGDP